MKPIAILIAGDPVPAARKRSGGFAAMIRRSAPTEQHWLELDLRSAHSFPAPGGVAGVIVTGSASSVVDREAWTVRGEQMLRELVAASVPVFGICYGHQMLGQALGGQVQKNPHGREIGTVQVQQIQSDPIVGGTGQYMAHTTHVDSVVVLPPGALVLAQSALEPHAAVRFAEQAWGVQFHPEFDSGVMRDYVSARRAQLEAERLDSEAVLAGVVESPEAAAMLPRFVEHVRAR